MKPPFSATGPREGRRSTGKTMRNSLQFLPAAIVAFCSPAFVSAGMAQPAEMSSSSGIYSRDQALRGQATYEAECAYCHGDGLEGIDVSPPLAGMRFMSVWSGQSVAGLASRIRLTMPVERPGSLTVAQSADVVAFILQENGFPAGSLDLPASGSAQRAISIDNPSTTSR
jgi:S-disulfanyl-L-cysteine oxidoreductase SoxD